MTAVAEMAAARRTRQILTAMTRDKLALIGMVLIGVMIVAAIAGPWLAPYPDQGAGVADVAQRNLAPGGGHLLGTDPLGRDLLSRIIIGARPALMSLSHPVGPLGSMRAGPAVKTFYTFAVRSRFP